MFEVYFEICLETDSNFTIFIVTQKSIVLIAIDQELVKVVKKQDKETNYGSRILSVLSNSILIADTIQGV